MQLAETLAADRPLHAEIDAARRAVEDRLGALFPDRPGASLVEAAMREAVRGPAKRLRPLMTILGARDLGAHGLAAHGLAAHGLGPGDIGTRDLGTRDLGARRPGGRPARGAETRGAGAGAAAGGGLPAGAPDPALPGPALDLGVALELVHTASLVLDDLPSMDDAALRRGKPAIHVAFGEDVASLAAIALLTRAYALAAAAPGLAPEQRLEAVAILSEAAGPDGLVGGQLEDLRGGEGCAVRAGAVNDRKTGALFVAAARLACAVAQSTAECRARFDGFGRELGRAFQILDDLLDLQGNPQVMGKPNGQDAGKTTLVRVLGAKASRTELERHLAAAAAALAAMPGGCGRVACLLETTLGGALPAAAHAGPEPC